MSAKIDPITRSVVQHRLSSIVKEMGEAMLRTSYSQILNSSRDFSLAICDTGARLIAQADHLPVHVGALPWATLAVEERFKDVKPGDVILLNDPYHGGSHLPDLTAFVPVFAGATGEVRPVGCNGSNSVDVRLIATSSRPLPDDFHKGLAERISSTTVNLPPLRDRSGDIPSLARHLLTRFAEEPGMHALSIGNDALAVLMRYGWPGNVRQLAGVLFRAALQADGNSLTANDFPHIAIQSRFSGRRSDAAPDIGKLSADAAMSGAPGVTLYRPDGHLRTLEEIEADIIRLAIGHYRGRMTEVARRLGIGRSTLYRKLGELGIDTAA